MKLGSGTHLTYCTNIHPGESWGEVRDNLRAHLLRVREAFGKNERFGIGLRLSGRAASELLEVDSLARFAGWLDEHDLYVFTINGFPYGRFHSTRVKEAVYLPDWLDEERVVYTENLARILAALLPDDVSAGSVSTVPGAFRRRVRDDADEARIAENLLRTARSLQRMEEETGKYIGLALEPEPYCHIETTEEAVAFFERRLQSEIARRYVGVCFDACHMAVQFEQPAEGVHAFRQAAIRVFKVQLSVGLEVDEDMPVAALSPFADEVYLHQVVERGASGIKRYVDLPEAMASERSGMWRIHFHVPIFREAMGPFRNTQPYLRELLRLQREEAISQHLEVETYTWSVLPEEFRQEDVAVAIARELRWVRDILGE